MNDYKNIFRLDGRTAMLTGGLGLIGSEIAQALADFGATVYIADNDNAKAKNLPEDQSIRYVPMDITSEISVEAAIKDIRTATGKIDVLINCAYPRTADWGLEFEKIPYVSWKQNLNDHLGGYFLTCRKVAEQMKKDGGGSIINMGSIYGVVAPDFSIYEGTEMTMPAAYAAIKGGVIALTKYMATWYGAFKVRVNAVSPGGILDHQPASFVEKYSQRTPMGRLGLPGEIAGAVIYLASDASSYVTGQNIVVDGGWTAK
jgi:NAD(P)-dependent dehydrogenase (short-subunit alcohol dehydrogenase family)